MTDPTLLGYFLQASLVVKAIMLLLLSASIISWACILQRSIYLRNVYRATLKFEAMFWSGEDLVSLYHYFIKKHPQGIAAIFCAGFKEYTCCRKQLNSSHSATVPAIIANTRRALQATQIREQEKLEHTLPILAIIASTSPYIGLLGTVWGIIQAFQALAHVQQQATIAMVAPGIAEALIATALGLFTAIPALIAYNRIGAIVQQLYSHFQAFQEELINLVARQLQAAVSLPASLEVN